MKLDITSYSNSLPVVESILKAKNNQGMKIGEMASLIAVATQIPVLAVCYMIEQLQGTNSELEDLKARLQEFYNYDEITKS